LLRVAVWLELKVIDSFMMYCERSPMYCFAVVGKAEANNTRVTAASGKAVQCAMRAWSCARYREKEGK
jgi:hypothetical protein